MTAKFEVFLVGLILIPLFVDFVPSIQAKLLSWSRHQSISLASISIGAGMIFVFEFTNQIFSYITMSIGFLIFFVGFAVAMACLKHHQP